MLISGIYWIKGPEGKVYIGQSQTLTTRLRNHKTSLRKNKHENPKLQNAWNKYGESAFIFEVLMYFPVEDLDAAEQVALDSLPKENKYNIAVNAAAFARGLTWRLSDETKRRMSVASKGVRKSEAHCASMSAAAKGVPKPSKRGNKYGCANKGRRGHKPSEETKAKMTTSQKMRWDRIKSA